MAPEMHDASMRAKPSILFLCHSASRNGATILLLHFLRWLKEASDWDVHVLIAGTGPLLDEFRAVAKTTVWRSPLFVLNVLPERIIGALRSKWEVRCLKAFLAGQRFDLVYANTLASWPLVAAVHHRASALVWHIHELTYAFRLAGGGEQIAGLLASTSKFVAVSTSVKEALLHEFRLPDQDIELVHEFIPTSETVEKERQSARERILRLLGWPDDAFVVGGCGTLGWRKGTDLFLQIARAVSRTKDREKVRFLWVGGSGSEDQNTLEFDYDLRALGLAGCCCRVPSTADVLPYYWAMDVFAVTSREDPFPLVMLEAGLQGLPVVCFADSGGGTEFVGEDAGLVAPYLDLPAFAAHLMKLQDAPELRQRLGTAAAAKVRTSFSVEVQAPKLMKTIEECLARPIAQTLTQARA
jgi:glycosyltransferase involved in cell wall biosynthesis